MTTTHTNEISGVPYLRPLSHPDEAEALVQQYPVAISCDCTGELEGVLMVRLTACDRQGDTPRMRYLRGCNEVFRCPRCGEYELFPPAGCESFVRDEWPAWGSLRGWPTDKGAA